MSSKIYEMPIERLHPFENQPYKVLDNEDMNALAESIQENGVLTPLLVRGLGSGEYEIVSGHRRLHACAKLGITKVPVVIKDMSQDEAAIQLVDSNLHREKILPSEKAFAYKLKSEALKHQGKSLGQVVPKPDDKRTASEIGEPYGESYKTVQRYIRLTNLIPELIDMVDNGRMAITPAVELSYLSDTEQKELLSIIDSEDRTPSLSQAQYMKRLSQNGELNIDMILNIMTEEKANESQKICFIYDDLKKYFPRDYTPRKMQEAMLRLVRNDYERKKQNIER